MTGFGHMGGKYSVALTTIDNPVRENCYLSVTLALCGLLPSLHLEGAGRPEDGPACWDPPYLSPSEHCEDETPFVSSAGENVVLT